jgi:hypothetical protein
MDRPFGTGHAVEKHWTDCLSDLMPVRRTNVRTYPVQPDGVVVDALRGQVHQLNATAGEIWQMCDGRTDLAAMVRSLVERFEVSNEAALDHVEQVVAAIAEANLLADEVAP